MANYTVFGSAAPTYTMTAYTDGNPSIIVGNYFYTYGSGTAGWRCRGGRVYIPNNADVTSKSITIKAWKGSLTGAPVDLSTTPLKEGTVTTGASGGWAEVLWDVPFAMVSGSDYVFIGYQFQTDSDQNYIHTASPQSGFVRSVDDVDLVLAKTLLRAPLQELSVANYVLVREARQVRLLGMGQI